MSLICSTGYLCTRHHELLLGGRLKFYYYEILLGPREEDPDEILNSDLTLVRESVRAMTQSQHDDMRCLVLKNLLMYLQVRFDFGPFLGNRI